MGILGDDLLRLLVLAVGAAMVVGNVGALVRPPERRHDDGDLEKAPVGRSLFMAGLGGFAALWALVSLAQ